MSQRGATLVAARRAGFTVVVTQRFGEECKVALRYSWPMRAVLTYLLLAIHNHGKLRVYLVDEAPTMVDQEEWKQLRLARYRIPAPEIMDMYMDPSEGHDDCLISIALIMEALMSYVRSMALHEEQRQCMSESFIASRRRMPSPTSRAISALTAFPSMREALWSAGKPRSASKWTAQGLVRA